MTKLPLTLAAWNTRADLLAPDPMNDPKVKALVEVLHGEEDRGYCLSPAARAALAAIKESP